MIRKNNAIQGVIIRELECKITQFTDDTTCFVSSITSLKAVAESLLLFGRFSGLKINKEKSAILPLGERPKEENVDAGPLRIQLANKVKILGIWFSPSRSTQEHWEWNFLPQLLRMRAVCNSWINRSLSIKGRITVFNSLIFSLLQRLKSLRSNLSGQTKGVKWRTTP